MPATNIMEVGQNVPFNILVANLTNVLVQVPNYKLLYAFEDSIPNITDPE